MRLAQFLCVSHGLFESIVGLASWLHGATLPFSWCANLSLFLSVLGLKIVSYSKLLLTRSWWYLGNPWGGWWRALTIFSMYRVHLGHLSTRASHVASPGIYMCDGSSKINCLSSNLSPTHSYYQYGHSILRNAGELGQLKKSWHFYTPCEKK